jgi:nitrogen fixation/metabolism regulation signal transduction histidine kinase|tara:strand:+ start:18368 stop:19768 length:1401 start_codon:yes stop_codon:yes gene_type:complete
MTSLVVIAFGGIAFLTIPQYKEQSNKYHEQRLERKKTQLQRSISYVFQETPFGLNKKEIDSVFKEKIFQIADVQNVNFSIYSLEGTLLNSTIIDSVNNKISDSVLIKLNQSKELSIIEKTNIGGIQYRSSYSLVLDTFSNPIWILNLPYYDDDTLNTYELDSFIIIFGEVYFLILIIAIIFSYLISVYITKSLSEIGKKIKLTRIDKKNSKIQIKARSKEVNILVESYNKMVGMLNESVEKLSKSYKEQAWREMAKQVAHEIKNPLTPMRLSVQSFQRNFDINDIEIDKKLDEFSKTLIQQIDTMSTIASAFSNFAEMPAQEGGKINIIETTRLALKIFKEKHINFKFEDKIIEVNIDRTQMVRIITNLIKNALEACDLLENPIIQVNIKKKNKNVLIDVIDNGVGIPEEIRTKIFEPKFTTKSSGMGLGLGMVKNLVSSYGGNISFKSTINSGTSFLISFPISKR